MSTRFLYGDAAPIVAGPRLTAQAIATGDLVGLNTNVVRASDTVWDTNLATTQADFVAYFLGVSGQTALSGTARIYGDSTDNVIRVDTGGFFEFDCVSASFTVGQFVGPAKDTGNALLNQTVVGVSGATMAIGVVVEAATSVTRVKVRVFSKVITASHP